MANMSYYRFRGTEADLRDCLRVLDNHDEIALMDEERAARRMIVMMFDFLDYNDLLVTSDGEMVIGLDHKNIEKLFRRGDSDQYSA